ncbi:MAG TPA: M24 family metallopeptidase [Gemmataceae bacterium]|nr:M24 family metallopeptidase [Gemmataceae bacterium]
MGKRDFQSVRSEADGKSDNDSKGETATKFVAFIKMQWYVFVLQGPAESGLDVRTLSSRLMNANTETTLVPTAPAPVDTAALETGSDRRTDIDAKMTLVAELLKEVGCDGLLLLDPDNFAWLTAGATARGILDPGEHPAGYCNGEQRWVLCSNLDSQRLFDEEVGELGFQLKEWPYHWGRDQLLADLCQGRRVACDQPLGECKVVGEELRLLRRRLTVYEQACLEAVGGLVSHALEATCRTMQPGITERELAAQVSHRLMHRGVQVVSVSVAAEGRSQTYRRHGFTSMAVERYALLTATGRKYGVCATASRAVSFGDPGEEFRKDHNTVCKVSATYLASTWPDAVPREILLAGRRIYLLSGFEHEWLLAAQGHVTGRAPVELPLLPSTEELFQAGWAVTWSASAGSALSCDTFLLTDKGPKIVTPTEVWPLKRIRVQGADFIRPDILQR